MPQNIETHKNDIHKYRGHQQTLTTSNGFSLPRSHGVGTEYGLWNKEQCVKYIEIKQARQTPSIPNFFAVDPSSAEIICGQLAVSLIAQLVQFIAVHFLVFTCVYILWANQQVAALLTMQRLEGSYYC